MMAVMTAFLVLFALLVKKAEPFSAQPWSANDIPGIWRLTTVPKEEDRLLRILNDGTFLESKEGYHSQKGLLTGLWDYKESDNTLLLAVESEKEALSLEGKLQASESSMLANDGAKQRRRRQVQVSLAVEGTVYTGTRLHPRTHPSYFELYQPKQQGTFSLRQVLGRLFVRQAEPEEEETDVEPKFQPSDFYEQQSFWLAVSPLPKKERHEPSQQKDDRSVEDVMREEAVDIRLAPIDFFQNNTFCATGTDKILRGRFGVKDQVLWFQVSLFGAGRTVSGSVYSEGKGLTHEDRRSYKGTIRKNQENELIVEGNVFIGSDLGSDARPEPVAVFSLKPRTTPDENQDDSDYYSEPGAFE